MISNTLKPSPLPQCKSDPSQREVLRRLIAEIWHTDEVRQRRPTPLDEARWGFAVIENSLWDAVPRVMRAADEAMTQEGLAETLIERLAELRASILALRETKALIADQPLLRDSLAVRNTYLDPLHLLQAELLHRLRQEGDRRPAISRSLKITMAGIASGLCNSG